MDTFEITIQRRIDNGWPVVIEQKTAASSIPVRKEGLFVFDESELDLHLTPRAYGTLLGQSLFREEIRSAFAKAIAESNDRLRVLLFIEAEDLLPLRWERLCAPLDSDWTFLSLNQRTLFSLYTPSITDRRFPAIGYRNMRALVVVASPHGLEQYGLEHFDVEATVAQIKAAMGSMPHDILADVDGAVGPASLDAIAARITVESYTILHMVCHGQFSRRSEDTSLFLSDHHNRVDRVDSERLLTRLRQIQGVHGLPHLGFFAACESAAPDAQQALGGLGQRLVRTLGMPAVIAMTDTISVETASELTAGFYQHLLRHGEVDRALAEAITPLAERADAITPALYSRLGGRTLFSRSTARALTEAEIEHGLLDLHPLIEQRAPVLLSRFTTLSMQLRRTLNVPVESSSSALQQERKAAMADLDALCREVTDISFAALCVGEEPPAYDERCPFRGLHAFQVADQEFFFGREALVETLARRVKQSNFLALLGASGSGKSSLVLAGLLPRLRQHEPNLTIYHMTPGRDPLHQLQKFLPHLAASGQTNELLFVDQFEEIFTLCEDSQQRKLFIAKLLALLPSPEAEQPEQGAITTDYRSTMPMEAVPELASMAAVASMPRGGHQTIPIETISAQVDAGVRHRNAVLKHTSSPERVAAPKTIRIIITMRADFWGECAQYPELKQMMMAHQELITPMTGQELRRTMELQAAKVGLRFEADLSNTILDEVAEEPGAMPLLQHLLTELWKRRHGRWLRAEEYRHIGGVQKAIAHTADEVYEQLSFSEQALVRDLFVRLTRLDEDGYSKHHRDTRQRVQVEEIMCDTCDSGNVKALLARLADAKLIITSVNPVTQKEEVEVVHEALIQHWPRLQGWIDDNRARYRLRQAVNRAAQVWRDNGRHDDFLVHRGGQLDDARRLAEEPGFLVAFERAYIEACVALQEGIRRREVEAARKLAKAAEARRRAEEQARLLAEEHAADSARAAQRLKRRALAVACIGVLALVAACTASFFWKAARSERDMALIGESHLLTTLSMQQIETDPVAALHVALRALPFSNGERPYVPAAQLALTQALRTSAERKYLAVGGAIHSPEQVAFGGQNIAVGGDGLHLVTHDLEHVVSMSEEKFESVGWINDDTLFAATAESVQIWRSGENVANVSLPEGIGCLYLQPGAPHVEPQRIAVCSGTKLWVWTMGEPQPHSVHSFPTAVQNVQWSPDGTLLMGWDDEQFSVWKASSVTPLMLDGHEPSAPTVAANWSPDSKFLVTLLENGEICIWRVQPSQLRLTHTLPTLPCTTTPAGDATGDAQIWNHVQFLDGENFITWGDDGNATLWNIYGELVKKYSTENAVLRGIAPDSTHAQWAIYTDRGVGYLWSRPADTLLATLRGHTASILAAAWQENYIATSAADGTARIWDARTGAELMTLSGHADGSVSGRGDVLGVFWSDARHVVTFGEDGTFRRWQVFDEAGAPLCTGQDVYASPLCFRYSQALHGHSGDIWSARWLDSDTILTTGYDGTARRWSLSTGESLVLPNENDEWRVLLWDPTGQYVLTYADPTFLDPSAADEHNQRGLIWDINSGAIVGRVPGPIVGAFWMEDALIVVHENGDALRIDPKSGTILTRYTGHEAAILTAAVLGGRLATAHSDGTVCVWNLESGETEYVLNNGDEYPVYSVQWSADGYSLLAAGHSVTLWDVSTAKTLWSHAAEGFNSRARFSPNERFVAVIAEEQVAVLNAEGALVWMIPAHKQPVVDVQWTTGAAWGRGGERLLLLTWSGDGSARLWDIEGQSEIMRFSDPDPLNVAAVSPDGAHVLTAGYSGVLRVWESWLHEPETLLATAQSELTHPLPKSELLQ